ncbi:spore germination protein [Neobacillus niacini]|uniref:spore germination protein n=1 Tax=Neobacillus niacini TaxID=86668 RepID=UPI00285E23AE|nr:spore germination protein [Neobacillus niacini]MDR7001019.1 spore germination protein KA [Neobacillus niacini]
MSRNKVTMEHKNELQDTDEPLLRKSLNQNIELFYNLFQNDETLIVRNFQNKFLIAAKCSVIYINGMVNSKILNEDIIQPILNHDLEKGINSKNLLEELHYKIIVSNNIKKSKDINLLVTSLIEGKTIFLLDGYDEALILATKGWEARSISEPDSARVIRGPREGFTEAIMTNLTLIRRIIKNKDLKFKFKEIGERTCTKTCICYIDELVINDILVELEKRLEEIKIDGILDSGYIEELIRDAPFSLFNTVGYSERPDVVASKLLEGRIAIIVDGSPFVLTVPYLFIEGLQANEDYYNHFLFASFNRFLRAVAMFTSMSLPAIYLAVVTYHQEFIPTPLLLSIASARQGVPFPTGFGLLIMLLIFDMIREAGIRMPATIGQAVNIVGTLVVGQAIVEAKLVSAPVVIIAAVSGIMKLLNPTNLGPVALIRIFLLLLSSIIGIYGYIFGILLVILHLMNIRSFGVPYMMGLSTMKNHNGQDIWIRSPWWTMTLRPKIIGARNLVRQAGKNPKRK